MNHHKRRRGEIDVSHLSMTQAELHKATLGIQNCLDSLKEQQQRQQPQHHVQSCHDGTQGASVLISNASSSSYDERSLLASTTTATAASQLPDVAMWSDLRRSYRRLNGALAALENTLDNDESSSLEDDLNLSDTIHPSIQDLMMILQLSTDTISFLKVSERRPCTSDQIQDQVSNACFGACRILSYDTSMLPLEATDRLLDHVASLLELPPVINLSNQNQQHVIVIPLLELLHAILDRNRRDGDSVVPWWETHQLQQEHEQQQLQSPPIFLFLGKVQSIKLLQLILPIAIYNLRQYPLRVATHNSTDSRYQDQDPIHKKMLMELVRFCNAALEQVLILSQTEEDDDDGCDDFDDWLQHWMRRAYDVAYDVHQPLLEPDLVSQVVREETNALLRMIREFVIESMEMALDVIEVVTNEFLKASTLSVSLCTSSNTKNSSKEELWDDVISHTDLAMDVFRFLLLAKRNSRRHDSQQLEHQQERQAMLCNDIFHDKTQHPVTLNMQDCLNRLIFVLRSTWATFAQLVSTHLTNLDNPRVRQNTTTYLIRMALVLTYLSSPSTTSSRLTSLAKPSPSPHHAKATTLLRLVEYPSIITSAMLERLLDHWNDSKDSEWKLLLQAAIMSRFVLLSNHTGDSDPILTGLQKAYGANIRTTEPQEDPWQIFLMARMAPFNFGETPSMIAESGPTI